MVERQAAMIEQLERELDELRARLENGCHPRLRVLNRAVRGHRDAGDGLNDSYTSWQLYAGYGRVQSRQRAKIDRPTDIARAIPRSQSD